MYNHFLDASLKRFATILELPADEVLVKKLQRLGVKIGYLSINPIAVGFMPVDIFSDSNSTHAWATSYKDKIA
jgi:hypothetical protein